MSPVVDEYETTGVAIDWSDTNLCWGDSEWPTPLVILNLFQDPISSSTALAGLTTRHRS